MQELLVTLLSTLQALTMLLAAQGNLPPELASQIQQLQASVTQPTLIQTTVLDKYTPPTLSQINQDKGSAVINILCRAGGKLHSGTASGVIISPTGLVLTNAHMAQYLLLEQDSDAKVECTLRTGTPARAAYKAKVVYIPPKWVKDNAKQLTKTVQYGTGELDYAILQITETIDGTPLPESFAYIPPEEDSPIDFTDKEILIRAYPAEFLGSAIALRNLYPAATVTTIKSLATFKSADDPHKTPDLLRLGGSIVAQGGSSGGAVIDNGGKLLGIIVTSTRSDTTAERELSAISTEHINTTLRQDIGITLRQLSALPSNIIKNLAANSLQQSTDILVSYLNK